MAGLLAVQWLLVAGLLAIVIGLLTRAGRSTKRQLRRRGEPDPHTEVASDGEQWWRCNHCRRRWHTAPGGTRIKRVAKFRKWARQRARERGKQIPDWAVARGTRVCPSCASRDVRISSWQGSSRKPYDKPNRDTTSSGNLGLG